MPSGERFGRAPDVYRAGRYGLGPEHLWCTKAAAIRIDTSVVPEQTFITEKGPWFFELPAWPYWSDAAGLCSRFRFLAHLSVYLAAEAAVARKIYENDQQYRWIRGSLRERRLLERIRLTPEGIWSMKQKDWSAPCEVKA